VEVGVLALQLARGAGNGAPNQQGALRALASQPFGHVLLVAVAVGLAGFAIWRLAEAFVGHTPEAGQHNWKDRLGALGGAIAYGAVCALCIAVVLGRGGGGTGSHPQQATAGVLGWPAGRYLVGAAGAALLGFAAYQIVRAATRRFLDDSKTAEMGPAVERTIIAVAVVGIVARALAFALIGVFVVKAAVDYRPSDAVGLDGALHRLLDHAYGTLAVGAVAVGLMLYGAYSIADARYHRI